MASQKSKERIEKLRKEQGRKPPPRKSEPEVASEAEVASVAPVVAEVPEPLLKSFAIALTHAEASAHIESVKGLRDIGGLRGVLVLGRLFGPARAEEAGIQPADVHRTLDGMQELISRFERGERIEFFASIGDDLSARFVIETA
jgi:hypothetical protein